MTAAAPALHATAGAHGHDHINRLRVNRIGLWLFILSESFLFFAFISSRYVVTGLERPHDLNQILGLVLTGVLLVSSLSAYRAEIFASMGNEGGLRQNMLITIGLALVFLAGVGYEWYEAFRHFPPSTAFGTMFFSLTGLHAFHVLTGMLALLVIYFRSKSVKYGPGNYWGVEGTAKYWHFVDLAWVFIYPTLYLVG